MGGEIPPFQKESKMSENISFLQMTEILSPINNDVEKLKEIFFSRYSYSNDVDWLVDVGSIIHDLCEQTGNEDHHMYPKEEFIESYVTG